MVAREEDGVAAGGGRRRERRVVPCRRTLATAAVEEEDAMGGGRGAVVNMVFFGGVVDGAVDRLLCALAELIVCEWTLWVVPIPGQHWGNKVVTVVLLVLNHQSMLLECSSQPRQRVATALERDLISVHVSETL